MTSSLIRPGPLKLIALPFTFTQDGLLQTDKFVSASRRCGHRLDLDHLQSLHKIGLLAPLFHVDDEPDLALRIDVKPNGNYDFRRQAQYAAAAGRLHDGAADSYADRPYRRPVSEGNNRNWWNGFLYSSWQLLDLDTILSSWHAIETGLIEPPVERLARQRRRTLALSALAPCYLPGVLGRLRTPPTMDELALRRCRIDSDVEALLRLVGYAPGHLQEDATNLLYDADGQDPLRDWLPLVRHVRYDGWTKLHDAARDALWQRIGAEVLLRAHEDLVGQGRLPALPDLTASRVRHALHGRLGRQAPTAAPLEETLGRFGLSPHPRVLLLVEGETELNHFPRLLEALGLGRPELVRVQLAKGSGKNPQLLARYAVTPRIGRQEADGSWPLTATPTALVVAMDPENTWATPDKRAKAKRTLQDAIREEVKLQGGEIGQDELDVLVNIHVWGDQKYELANFTDDALLNALSGLARGADDADRGTPAWLDRNRAALQRARAQHKDIDVVIGPMRIRKPALAEVLWPTLLAKCERELVAGTTETPALRVALDVERLVGLLSAGGYVLSPEIPNT